MLLVVGPLVYGLYYPQPYLNQILRKMLGEEVQQHVKRCSIHFVLHTRVTRGDTQQVVPR